VRQVRGEVAGMVLQTSERVIGRSLEREDHERLISEALDSLEVEVAGAPAGGDGRAS
jgi:F-type H+-transporting ATPase subunit b